MFRKYSQKIFFPILVFMLLYLGGCVSAPKTSSRKVKYLTEFAQRNGFQWQLDTVTQVVVLQRGPFRARALVGSDIVIVQGQDVQLSAPIERDRNGIVIPPDFEMKVLSRVKKTAIVLPKQKRKIMLDAGHGGKDPGALGYSGLQEKDVVWDITKRVKNLLESKGMTVVLTRKRDNFISLEERTEIAAREHPDLFVSIHANASKSRHPDGVEVYVMRPLTWEDRKEQQRIKNYRMLFNSLAMKKGNKSLEKIVAEMMERKKKSQSVDLASTMANRTSRAVNADNRGVKEAGYFVLRNALVPAVLVEVGFLSNSREERLLKDGGYRQNLAQAISDSIVQYFLQ